MEVPQFIIPYLKIAHSLFNICIFLAFLYQAKMGFRIRQNRLADEKTEALPIRRHRRLGPILTVLVPLGFFAGLILTYVDHDILLKFPYHLLTGALLVTAVVLTWLISRNIKGTRPEGRTIHAVIGVVILLLFLVQLFLGLNALV